MCGIYCHICFVKSDKNISSKTHNLLSRRGPDSTDSKHISIGPIEISFYGHVLWQQGQQKLFSQPCIKDQHVLLFNGDIYSKHTIKEQSDTEWLLNEISSKTNEEQLLNFLSTLTGPYSIIYLDTQKSKLYFFRDSLGRQSLLLGRQSSEQLSITSVAEKNSDTTYIELPPVGVFKYDFITSQLFLYPWHDNFLSNSTYLQLFQSVEEITEKNIQIQKAISPDWLLDNENENRLFNFEEIVQNAPSQKDPFELFTRLLEHDNIKYACNTLVCHLMASVRDRVLATPPFCKRCINSSTQCSHCKIGILFSGGIDCTILAVLTDKFVKSNESIDLINVSFEKVRRLTNNTDPINYNTPDRISARATYDELQKLCPERRWNLVEVNVTRKELEHSLQNHITHLVYPLESILDESLGAALWYAATGKGEYYQSSCRVLLMGSGADELFGGYTRHRNAFTRSNGNWEALKEELHLDWVRLPSRNLARDDRVIGDHGITVRAPYVQEEFSKFVRNLEPYQKCYHRLDQGVGDKLLLRLCAFDMGLRDVTVMKKRALQFGSRIADSKQNAKDKSLLLT